MTKLIKKGLISVFLALTLLVSTPKQADAFFGIDLSGLGDALSTIGSAVVRVGKFVVDEAVIIAETAVDAAQAAINGDWDGIMNAIDNGVAKTEENFKSLVKDLIANFFNIQKYVCPPYATFKTENSNCQMCKVFMMIFDKSNQVCAAIARAVSPSASRALLSFFALWMAITVLQEFSNVGAGFDGAAMLTKIGGMLIRVTLAYLVLLDSCEWFFGHVINPTMDAMVDMVSAVSSSPCTVGSGGASSNAPLSPGVRSGMKCAIENIANGVSEVLSISAAIRCGANMWEPIDWLPIQIFHPLMWLYGCAIGVMFWFVSFIFPLVMLDIIFRIGIILGFAPIFFLAAVFDSTRPYTKQWYQTFFSSCMVFVVASIALAIVVDMVKSVLNIYGSNGASSFVSMIQGNQFVEAYLQLDTASLFLSLIAINGIGFWAIQIAPKCDEITKGLFGGVAIESCAEKAFKAMANLAFSILILILTIVTCGIGSILYVCRAVKFVADSAKALQKIMKALKKMQKAAKNAQRVLEKAKGFSQRMME